MNSTVSSSDPITLRSFVLHNNKETLRQHRTSKTEAHTMLAADSHGDIQKVKGEVVCYSLVSKSHSFRISVGLLAVLA